MFSVTASKITRKHYISFAVLCLLPLAAIILGVFLLFKRAVFTAPFAVTYLLVPVIAIVLFAIIVFHSDTFSSKVLFASVLSVLFIFIFAFKVIFTPLTFMKIYRNDDVYENYCKTTDIFAVMPTLDELGDYSEIEYFNFVSGVAIFDWEADTLKIYYSPEEYEIQKSLLFNKYHFIDSRNQLTFHCGRQCNSTAEIDGYNFSVLSFDDKYGYELMCPNRMVVVAVNDVNHTISYIAMQDDELDYIENLDEFILDNCCWRYIK